MSDAPFFSIIIVDYEGAVSREAFRRKINSVLAQNCQDFEVLVYHDGPKSTPYEEDLIGLPISDKFRFISTEKRENCWGHSNRDRGIRAAKGTWIVNSNADNLFYSDLLECLKERVEQGPVRVGKVRRLPIGIKSLAKRCDRVFGTNYLGRATQDRGEVQILVYPVIMRGLVVAGSGTVRQPVEDETGGEDHRNGIVYGGIPIEPGHIDLMQFVMRRDLWLAEGGWSDTRENSDGRLYKRFARKYNTATVTRVLGEHY